MTLLAACAALLLMTLAVVLLPLLSRGTTTEASPDRAVYRAQIAELDQDIARFLLAPAEAEFARTEIARRLLATEARPAKIVDSGPSALLAGVLALLLTGAAGGLYLSQGAPGLRPAPRTGAAERAQLESAVAVLETALRAEPGNAERWLIYARSTSALGQWPKAAEAYRRMLDLHPGAPEILAALGEALALAEGGVVTPDATAAFLQAPDNPIARYYLALAAAQRGETQPAIAAWRALAADLPDSSDLRSAIAARLAETAKSAGIVALPMPDPATIATADTMPPEQRAAMVRAMVDRLAERLAAQPDDIEGWLRLGRAYLVLNEAEKSADAYDHAARQQPGPDIRLQEIAALIETTPPTAPLPARAQTLVNTLAAQAPDQPEIIWYTGLVAARTGQRADALRHWERLLILLPPASQERILVQSAIDALKGN